MTTLDVAIIGAGISGINTAYRVQGAIPGINYTIFESRNEIGGTWSFFKYPGLRSDSDLFSFGFEWNPWESDEVIADAESIMTYLNRSLDLFGGREKLALGHRLEAIDWSSKEQVWTLKFKDQPDVRARWVVLGTGYYDYENALPASIPGLDKFKGTIVHPQFWPEDLDLTNKRVAIIGSGATAITILPSIVDQAAHVTMIQRSPSFVGKLPRKDAQAQMLKRWLPLTWATRVLRLKYLALSWLFFNFCQRFPQRARKAILKETKRSLPSTIPVDPHFEPKYQPWDQRFCMCPDGDFYKALRSGKANIITGHIESMTESSIQIKDQPESTIDADIIVTATGLKILVGGGADVSVDGVPFSPPDKMIWKGCMLQDVPNALVMIGYTNASWTLGADVAAKTLTRLLKRLKDESLSSATPVAPKDINTQPFMKMQSTYLLKGKGDMPMGGDRYPWLPRGSYFSDIWDATFGDITTDLVLKPRA